MSLLGSFRKKGTTSSASLAKNRLGILIATSRIDHNMPSFLPQMREEILQVIAKYISIDRDAIQVMMDHNNGVDTLEIEIPLT
jgi:cell division topological specificity factor